MSTTTTSTLPAHFQPRTKIHIIISVLSGRHKAHEYFSSTLQPFLTSLNLPYTTHTTTSASTIIELTRTLFLPAAQTGVPQTIILLSGDGGVVDIVNTLASSATESDSSEFVRPVVCLVPMGTANALAWSSAVAGDVLGVMMRGVARRVPMFKARFSDGARLVVDEGRGRERVDVGVEGWPTMFGVVVVSWGLHASLVAMSDSAEYRRHGLERFRMAAEVLLKEGHRYQGTVRVRGKGEGWKVLYDGEDSGEHAYVLATLVSGLEEKFKISPDSEPLDGTMRIVAFKPYESKEVMRILTLAYQNGEHVEEDKVVYEEIEKMRIEIHEEDERWREVCIDGKIVALEPGGWMEVEMLPADGVGGKCVIDLVC